MAALRALIAAMPDICRTLDQIDPRWHDMVFARLADVAEREAVNHPGNVTWAGAGTYEPSATALMAPVRDGYDPLSAR